MGYACPVCSDPQADAGHLANHLAFTAILGDSDHETWLDELAPEWSEMGERELASIVSESVEETDFPQLFDDTAGGLDAESDESLSKRSGALFDEGEHDHDHTRGHGRGYGSGPGRRAIDTSGAMDEEAEAVLEEARELTRRMLEEENDSE